MGTAVTDIARTAGMYAILQIGLSLLCIALAWWMLQNVRWDIFLKQTGNAQAKLLQIVLSIVLGFMLCQFLLVYSGWSTLIKELVE